MELTAFAMAYQRRTLDGDGFVVAEIYPLFAQKSPFSSNLGNMSKYLERALGHRVTMRRKDVKGAIRIIAPTSTSDAMCVMAAVPRLKIHLIDNFEIFDSLKMAKVG